MLLIKPNETRAHEQCAGHWMAERIRFLEQLFSLLEDRVGSGRCEDTRRQMMQSELNGKRRQEPQANPLNIGCRGCGCNLRCLISANFRPAATHLLHMSALPVHRPAASTLFMVHYDTSQASHNRRSCGKQEENRDDTGKAASATSV